MLPLLLTSLLVAGNARLSVVCSYEPAHALSLALHQSIYAVLRCSEQHETAMQPSFTSRESKSCGTAKRSLAHPTSSSSERANDLPQFNPVSKESDHIFRREGAMEFTLCFTVSYSIMLKRYEKLCL